MTLSKLQHLFLRKLCVESNRGTGRGSPLISARPIWSFAAFVSMSCLCGCTLSQSQERPSSSSLPVFYDRGEAPTAAQRTTRYESIWKEVFDGEWGRSLATVRVVEERWESHRDHSRPSSGEPYIEMRSEAYNATVELAIGEQSYIIHESALSNIGASRTTVVREVAKRVARKVSEYLAGHGLD